MSEILFDVKDNTSVGITWVSSLVMIAFLAIFIMVKKREKVSEIVTISTELKSAYVKGDNDYGLKHYTFLALDCEMVGIGRGGMINILARCSIVKIQDGEIRVVYDKVVKPKARQKITDYRTKYSGITKEMIERSSSIPFEQCKREVSDIFSYNGKKCCIVGHGLENDFEVLEIRHPWHLIRDTALFKEFTLSRKRSQKLRHLVSEHLDMSIQTSASGHCSVEDAASVLLLYKKFQTEWESSLGNPLKKLDKIEEKKMLKIF